MEVDIDLTQVFRLICEEYLPILFFISILLFHFSFIQTILINTCNFHTITLRQNY